jgi:hypothetical protein
MRWPTRRLNSVDLLTLGRPTMAMVFCLDMRCGPSRRPDLIRQLRDVLCYRWSEICCHLEIGEDPAHAGSILDCRKQFGGDKVLRYAQDESRIDY